MAKSRRVTREAEVSADLVLFQGKTRLAPGDVHLHGLTSLSERVFGRKLTDVKKDWARVTAQIKELLDATSERAPSGFALESIEVSLGFSAKGQIVFIAEAGVEASVTVTFKRPSAG